LQSVSRVFDTVFTKNTEGGKNPQPLDYQRDSQAVVAKKGETLRGYNFVQKLLFQFKIYKLKKYVIVSKVLLGKFRNENLTVIQ
jgi:hypothetical protein